MAMSVNGIIALEDDSEDFLSREGGKLISSLVLKSGSLIWGRRTYETVQKNFIDTFEAELTSIPKVVVTSNLEYKTTEKYLVAHSPLEAINLLKSLGVKNIAIVGGSKINSSFLELGLIDEIVINMEPAIIGRGLPLFAPLKIEVKVKLISVVQANKGELLLRYKVVK
jgi:dihydrofolate reductase